MFGHKKVSILDGGYAAWREFAPSKIEIGAFMAPEPGNFVAKFHPEYYIGTSDVAAFAANPGQALLVDGRTDEQFYAVGKHPKSARAGRIPSAVLMDQDRAYSSNSTGSDELASIYNDLGKKPSLAIAQVIGPQQIGLCCPKFWAKKMSSSTMARWSNGQQIPTCHSIRLANQTCKR